jgi:Acetyltransferase (GNAT) domain
MSRREPVFSRVMTGMAQMTAAECLPGSNAANAAANAPFWRRLDAASLRDSGLQSRLQEIIDQADDRVLYHNPSSLGAKADLGDTSARHAHEFHIGYDADGRLVGYAPLTCGSKLLRFPIGELLLYRRRLVSLTLVHDLVIDGGAEMRRALTARFLDDLAQRLRPQEGVFLEGVPIDSVLFELATNCGRGSRLLTLRLGDPFEHQFARLPPTFRDYEMQLGSHSRLNLRHRRKKLAQHVCGDLRTVRFSNPPDVDRFVADAQKISRTTYQWRLLGLGLRDAAALRATVGFAARQGWLRSYILYCGGEPAAFMLGYVYRRTYHYMDVGFDPAWTKWGVGSILQMEVIRDLIEIEDPDRPDTFDFATGDGDHKARFGNASRREANLLLLKNCPRNALCAAAYALTTAADKHAGRWLQRLGIKAQVKRWFRRVA